MVTLSAAKIVLTTAYRPIGGGSGSAEDDGAAAVEQDAVLGVPADGAELVWHGDPKSPDA